MAYFNHAFTKVFLGTEKDDTSPAGNTDEGFLTISGVPTKDLKSVYGTGVYGFFDPTTYKSVAIGDTQVTTGKPLILAASSLYSTDKIGPFAGGYQESTKSKIINPKYVSKFYRVDYCNPHANVIHIGTTDYTIREGTGNCCHPFLCNNTYYLRLDVKGSPVLRYLTRNAYWTADYYTGCCPTEDGSPTTNEAGTIVDPTLVMIGWANGLLGQITTDLVTDEIINEIPNKIVGPFIWITVTDYAGKVWYRPGSTVDPSGNAISSADWWDRYPASGTATGFDPNSDTCATTDAVGGGMTITGAYVDTVFGTCTFYPSDFFQKEPVQIYASEVDNLGDPCVFTGICVVEECAPLQGMGFGQQVLRDLILSESYQQNYFNTNLDLRIREVMHGTDIANAVDPTLQYTRYFLLHSVPRFNNPTGVFDNDQYLLQIITKEESGDFEAFMAAWLGACGCNVELEEFGCNTSTCPAPPIT